MKSWSFLRASIESIGKHNSKLKLPPPSHLGKQILHLQLYFQVHYEQKLLRKEQYQYYWLMIKVYKYSYVPLKPSCMHWIRVLVLCITLLLIVLLTIHLLSEIHYHFIKLRSEIIKIESYLGRNFIILTSKWITYRSKLKFLILIDLFKFYFTFKLIPLRSKFIPLRSKLINAQKMKKKKREKACDVVKRANWAGPNWRSHNETVSFKFLCKNFDYFRYFFEFMKQIKITNSCERWDIW